MREHPEMSSSNTDNSTVGELERVMGQLLREEADFYLLLTATAERLQVADYVRLEHTDSFIVVSGKPSLLPAVMSFIRPFSSMVVIAIRNFSVVYIN